MRNFFIKTLRILLVLILLIVGLLYLTDNQYILRGIMKTYLKGRTTAGIYDYTDFSNRVILSENGLAWQLHSNYNKTQLTDTLRKELETYETDAFLIIKDGKIWYEEYWNERQTTDISNSFSMAKTYVTMLMFKAIENGKIESLDQKITDFLPEFKNDPLGKICTVGDLSAMTSGYDWKENYYLPLNPTAKAYFGADIEEQMLERKFISEPGKQFSYLSGNTQLLAILLTRATGKNLTEQMTEYFWKPLGMERDALWSLDGDEKMEKAYCCVNATAQDFAKIGQLLLQKGHWNEKKLMDSAHIAKMVTPHSSGFPKGQPQVYGYSVWTDYEHQPNFYALLGHLGQRTIVIPEKNIVIVRLGKIKDQRLLGKGILEGSGVDIYYFVDEVLKMVEEN